MSYASFLSAVLALLLAPGPTNTLMALAAAQKGLRPVLRLLPSELLGYLTTILPLASLGGWLFDRWPAAGVTLKVAAAIWVMYLAVKLWEVRLRGRGKTEVTALRVYMTTVLNPKALIFGLVLLPVPVDSQFLPKLGLLGLSATAIALTWGLAGALTQIGEAGGTRLRIAQRIASIWLAVVSFTLLASLLRT
ncbi:hypothetical protein BPNPMPFG_007086 (plasmid) [Mesorhizobium sp. AR07]|uniref:hypothetical protein n=1 Tax=Mesorhizobium sp. AR07 TaxID=2865838 RepID=UPI00215E1EEF|nr:hypothetical protein [Mesorhizobium sp. AR07]UVK48661.1 hypothetical protein BPNPMPFG_007086 [Mesorhizobium sp. AR07]